MSGIFSPDSPTMRALAKLADVMLLNLLFLATSLPVVTLGASLTALSGTSMKLVTDRYDSVTVTYFSMFKRNFRQGTLLGLAVLGLLVVMGAWYVVISHLNIVPSLRLGAMAVFLLVCYRVVSTAAFVFAYQATFLDSVGTVLNNARRMSARHPLAAFLVMVITVVPVVAGIFYPQLFLWGLAWLAFGFSGISCLCAFVFVRVFRKYGLEA